MARILLIEDNLKNARLVEKVLTPHEHEVLFAVDGITGLEVVQREQPDLILLDMRLPDISGQRIAAIIRRLKLSAVPIVGMSAYEINQTRAAALAAGCDGFIGKPINTRKFPAQVEAYLVPPVSEEEAQESDTPETSDAPKEDDGKAATQRAD